MNSRLLRYCKRLLYYFGDIQCQKQNIQRTSTSAIKQQKDFQQLNTFVYHSRQIQRVYIALIDQDSESSIIGQIRQPFKRHFIYPSNLLFLLLPPTLFGSLMSRYISVDLPPKNIINFHNVEISYRQRGGSPTRAAEAYQIDRLVARFTNNELDANFLNNVAGASKQFQRMIKNLFKYARNPKTDDIDRVFNPAIDESIDLSKQKPPVKSIDIGLKYQQPIRKKADNLEHMEEIYRQKQEHLRELSRNRSQAELNSKLRRIAGLATLKTEGSISGRKAVSRGVSIHRPKEKEVKVQAYKRKAPKWVENQLQESSWLLKREGEYFYRDIRG